MVEGELEVDVMVVVWIASVVLVSPTLPCFLSLYLSIFSSTFLSVCFGWLAVGSSKFPSINILL